MEAVQKEVARWKAEQANKPKKEQAAPAEPTPVPEAAKPQEVPSEPEPAAARSLDFKAYVDVPTMEEIEKLIIQKQPNHRRCHPNQNLLLRGRWISRHMWMCQLWRRSRSLSSRSSQTTGGAIRTRTCCCAVA